jgi:hypothetical protein
MVDQAYYSDPQLTVEPADNDRIHGIGDISDTSESPNGTMKYGLWSLFKSLWTRHDLATAANDFLVASGAGVFVKKTLAETLTILAHASRHQSGGADAIQLDNLSAPDDNTDLDATTLKHGLLPKLGGGTSNFLRADGTWNAPAGGAHDAVTLAATVTDILSLSTQVLGGVDLAADKFVYWNNTSNKLTGATVAEARTLLSLVIGTNVQAWDADLDTWAGVTPGTGVATALAVALNASGGFATINGTATLTNKRVTPRAYAYAAPGATPTINTDTYDFVDLTGIATAITSMTTNLSGTPTNGQKLLLRFKDNGTARAIAWGASFEACGVALPTTTVISKRLTVGLIWDTTTSKWGCVGSVQEA